MKPRKIAVTLELETDASIRELKDKVIWTDYLDSWLVGIKIHQIQVNVVKEIK